MDTVYASASSNRYSNWQRSLRSIGVTNGHAIHLTYPKTHSLEEIIDLLGKYRAEHPEIVANWIEIERRDEWPGDPLAEINRHGIEFLMSHTKWDSFMALSQAWSDWRRKVMAWAFAH